MWLVAEEFKKFFFLPRDSHESLLVCRGDVFDVKLDGNIAPSSLDKDSDLFLIFRDRLNGALVAVKQTALHLHLIADVKHKLYLLFVDAERLDLRVKERCGTRAGTNKARNARDISYHVPAFLRHDHFYQNITGKDLVFDLFFFVALLFNDRLNRDANVKYKVTETAVLHDLYKVGHDLVFVTGIRMHHIPTYPDVHFVYIAHCSEELAQSNNALGEEEIEQTDQNGKRRNENKNDDCILLDVIFGRPDNFFELTL